MLMNNKYIFCFKLELKIKNLITQKCGYGICKIYVHVDLPYIYRVVAIKSGGWTNILRCLQMRHKR